MKFFTVLAILSVAALATAAPCGHEDNHSNHEENNKNVDVKQTINNGGSAPAHEGGLVSKK
jgi:hypothetical protein